MTDYGEQRFWAVGGGKGGTGKSVIATNIAVQLARRGKKVIMVDADLGGGNLHTYLGINLPKTSLADFLKNKDYRLEQVMVETPHENLRLISDANDVLGLANTSFLQKERFIRHIRNLSFDYVIIDLGAGTANTMLDFFLISNSGFLVSVPEPAAIENAYRFIRCALYRRLSRAFTDQPVKGLVEKLMYPRDGIKSVYELVEKVNEIEPETAKEMVREIKSFQPKLIMNQVQTEEDITLGESIRDVVLKFLGVRLTYIGYVSYDSRLKRASTKRLPLFTEFPNCGAAICIRNIVNKFLESKEGHIGYKGGGRLGNEEGFTTQPV
ncbi:P-loop NTPase [bacterium]|nr:P-loop NTPase [bacterium]